MEITSQKRPEVVLDNWPEVYDSFEGQEPAPGFIEYMSDKYEKKLRPILIIDDETQEEIAQAVESGRPLIFNMSHGHEDDTVLGAIALGKTAVKEVLSRIVILAKDELFRVDEDAEDIEQARFKKQVVEMIALPVFHPKRWSDPKYRLDLLGSAKRVQSMVVERATRKRQRQHVFIHGEGGRNTTENKTKVQEMRALLARIAFGIRSKGHDPVVIPIGIAYQDEEAKSAVGAVVVVGGPMTDLPERQSDFNALAQQKLQELVDRGKQEIEASSLEHSKS